ASRNAGMSLKNTCSCRFFVPVDTSTRWRLRMVGIRYASVLPVPVPASASSVPPLSTTEATALAMRRCPSRGSKPGIAVAIAPSSASAASTSAVRDEASAFGIIAQDHVGIVSRTGNRCTHRGSQLSDRPSIKCLIVGSQIDEPFEMTGEGGTKRVNVGPGCLEQGRTDFDLPDDRSTREQPRRTSDDVRLPALRVALHVSNAVEVRAETRAPGIETKRRHAN